MKRTIACLLLICILIPITACGGGGVQNSYKTRNRTISSVYFNTYSQISTYADESDDNIDSYVKIADEVLSYYHELFDIYYEYSGVNNIKTINKSAGKSPVTVDAALIDFLEYCKELYEITGGKTNVMLGAVLKLWHDCREAADDNFGYLSEDELPTEEELNEAMQHTSIDSLIIDRENSTVYISDPDASLDVGAIAKGYTVDILCERIEEAGAKHTVLNIGGNIRTIGLKPDGGLWVTGITNPDRNSENTLICKIKLGSASIVTSGDYERYMMVGDKRYHHIIDPATKRPAEYFSAVSIITESSGLADALSTALFCMSYEEGAALVQEIGGIDVIWISADGSIKATDGIAFHNE